MNLAPREKNLLFAIVDAHTSGHGSRFTFTRSHSGSALYYQGHGSIRVDADDNDLALLERRRLVMIFSKGSGPLIAITSQLTQLGIETATTLRSHALPSEERPLSAPTTDGISERPLSLQPSWKDLQAEFLQYAAGHAELAAVWSWSYPAATIAAAVAAALAQGPDANPYEVLRQMYEDPNVSARPPAPKGQWTLEGGSPLSQNLFRVIAGRAASRLPNPSDAEPWRLWLDGMGAEGYGPAMPARSKSGQILRPYPQGFADRHIEHVFNASADFCFVRSRAEAATPNPVALGTPAAGEPARLAAIPSQESAVGAMADLPRLPPNTSAGRPKLPTEALQNIIDAEKAATGELEKALGFHRPSNPNFVYHPVEINAGCWKVIEYLTTFAEAIFNAQAREYAKHYPALVFGGDLLTAEVGPEVVKRTKLRWTRWETEIDGALRVRWPPDYYRAYVEEANQPGSEDLKLVEHFLRRLDDTVADRSNFWREQAKAVGHGTPPTPEHAALTTLGEPTPAASEPPVASGGAAQSTDRPAVGTEEQAQIWPQSTPETTPRSSQADHTLAAQATDPLKASEPGSRVPPAAPDGVPSLKPGSQNLAQAPTSPKSEPESRADPTLGRVRHLSLLDRVLDHCCPRQAQI
jgi:hypothetical protein